MMKRYCLVGIGTVLDLNVKTVEGRRNCLKDMKSTSENTFSLGTCSDTWG